MVEDRIELPKVVKSEGSKGKSFLPPNALELIVSVVGTKDVLFLRERLDTVGKVSIVLSTGDSVILRQGHFNHDWHHNPNGVEVSPPHHIHFPTEGYPDLSRHHSYAYPVKGKGDYISALYKICEDCNVKVHGIPIPLLKK